MGTTRLPAVYELDNLLSARTLSGRPYHEFLRHESMSAGIYRLEAGEPDRQRPHNEDEIYYVLEGHGAIEIDGALTAISSGSVVFVPKQARHRFIDYPDGLTLLVFFAPAHVEG